MLELIGAGELEAFLTRYAADYIDAVEEQARADPRFAFALSCVWMWRGAFPADVEERLSRATDGEILFLDRKDADAPE